MTPCPYCGTPMTNPRRKQCGEPPCKRAYNAERMRRFFAEWKAANGERYERQYRDPKVEQVCKACGQTFHRANLVRSCSPACQVQLKLRKERFLRRMATIRRKLDAAAKGTHGDAAFFYGPCQCCGTNYTTRRTEVRWCSHACKRRQLNARRRARKQQAYVADVAPIAIYERDEWTCKICGLDVNRDQAVPWPFAPTIDHIIPLAKGGTHEPDNVQCAHFICNSMKSDNTTS